MLVHYFGCRDALVRTALGVARDEMVASVRGQLGGRRGDVQALIGALRLIVGSETNRPYFRLFAEVSAIARARPESFTGFGRASVHDWLPDLTRFLMDAGRDPHRAEAEATLALAIVRGLLLDENATGETVRIQAAYDSIADL